MKKYLVQEKFTKTRNVVIDAESKDDAKRLVEDGYGEEVDIDEYDADIVFVEEMKN